MIPENNNKNILIIGNDAEIRKWITTYLHPYNFNIIEVEESFRSVEKIFLETSVNLVIYHLRTISTTFLRIISEIKNKSDEIPIVAISDKEDIPFVLEVIQAGVWDYLTIPLHDVKNLGLTVIKNLGRADALKKNRKQQDTPEKKTIVSELKERLSEEIHRREELEKALESSQSNFNVLFDNLKESETRYKTLFDSAQEAIFLIRGESIVDCNEATCHLFECRREELIGASIFHLCPSYQPDGMASSHKGTTYVRQMLSGNLQRFEWTFKTFKDRFIDVVISFSKLHIHGYSHLLTMAWDITEQKQTQKILQKEHRRLSDILDGNPLATFMIDSHRKVVYWNKACEILTGITKEDVFGKALAAVTPYSDKYRPVLAELILRLDDQTLLEKYSYKNIRKSDIQDETFEVKDTVRLRGEKKVLSVLATRIRDPFGNITGAIQCVQDITEREKLQEQLRQAQKMEAIGTLAGGIAHDFNNILFPIIGYAEMTMEMLPKDSPFQKNLEQIYMAAYRARDLVRQILSFSRESSQEFKPLRIQLIVKETLKFLRASLPTTIEIRRRVNNDCGYVLANPTQIHQVLMNLCTNAFHAMRKTGGVLEVILDEIELSEEAVISGEKISAGKYLILSVADTGCGMDEEILKQIFIPYFTTKTPQEGTGLGLSVVCGIVSTHNGHIMVESTPGKGSTFTIYFPVIHKKERDAERILVEPSPTGNEHILLVDDETQIVQMIGQMLEIFGYKITPVTESPEALKLFQEYPKDFDLVLTDMTMPQMTGIELSKKILEIRPDTPIILCTGFSEIITEDEVKALGICEFLLKPIVKSRLANVIRKALDSRKE